MENLLKIAIISALEAGKIVLDIYNSNDFEVQLKEDNSPLTKADLVAHSIILSHLCNTNIPILSEEGELIPYEIRKQWTKLWIVDPIDGTKEFIKRNGEFTVNIALIENQKPVLGVILVPVSGDLYFSSREKGSFKVRVNLNKYNIDSLLKYASKLPLERDDKTFTIVSSRSHMSKQTVAFINKLRQQHSKVKLISKGSSLKLCMMAEGQADCYPRFAPTMEWDTAAGQAICEYSGFELIDLNTKESMLYNRKELLNGSFIVKKA